MSVRSVLAVTIAVLLVLSGLSLSKAQSASVPDLPAGDMQVKARTSCTECHDARIILQQRLSKETWMKEVDKMIKWGALVDPKDRNALIDYLNTNFPADKAPEVPVRVGK